MFNINNEIRKYISSEIDNQGSINVLLFDTETTGLTLPEITQFGGIVVRITFNENKELSFEIIKEFENDFYPSKVLEPDAVRITRIIREEDLENKKYISEVIKNFSDHKEKITLSNIKKEFNILKLDLPAFETSYFYNIVNEHKIKLFSGHNIYQYDIKEVLDTVYGIKIPAIQIFDTMFSNIYNKKAKTNQGRTLSNEVNKILKHIPDGEKTIVLGQIEDRETAHSALLDIKVNYILFKYQLEEIFSDKENQSNNTRPYSENDILYVQTHMSNDNILLEEQIFDFCKDKNIEKVVIVDQQWTKYISLIKAFKEKGIDLIIGFQALNLDTEEYFDIIIKDTLNYRLLLPLLIEGQFVRNQNIEDIKKYTKNIVLSSSKMATPKYYTKDDKLNFFVGNKLLRNEAYTQQEIEVFKLIETPDESLKTGLFTSNVKQEWLKKSISGFETVDFTFYSSLGLSAFPPMNVLHPSINKEPENIEEALEMLEMFYEEQWELRKIDDIIKKSGLDKQLYIERKNKEFSILKQIGKIDFIKYFFLVYKIGNVMEGTLDNKILDKDNPNFKVIREAFGYGRGSAPGSLVAFVTGTTGLDPLKYSLLFERFIDPSRPDYPDIDLDIINKEFAFNILQEYFNKEMVKELDYSKKPYDIYDPYILETYIKPSTDFLGKIKTTAYTTSKVILGSLLRLNQMPFFIQSIISKEFDGIVAANGGNSKGILLEDVIEQSEIKEDILRKMPIELFQEANKLVNLYNSSGIHAGGVLFFPHHPNVILPMKNNVVEFGMRDLESLLQIKMDLLGLNTREVIEDIKKILIKANKSDIIYKHNFDDLDKPEVFRGLYKKFTSQTFQMGSSGMDRLLYLLSPLKFEDLIAITALFRPGPLGSGAVDNYISSAIKAKRDKYNIEYIPLIEFNSMEDNLKDMLFEQHREKMKADFDEMLLEDEVILNIITYENYYDSQKFQSMIESKFNSSDNEIVQDIKAKFNILDVNHFKQVILDFENKITSNLNYQNITADTYHTMVYQEQIMHISVQLANYTVLESNKLRKAIAKQNKELMDIQKVKFIEGITSDKIKKVEYSGEFEKYIISKTTTNDISIFNKDTKEESIVSGFLENNGIISINEYTSEIFIDLIDGLNKQVNEDKANVIIEKSDFSELEAKYFWDKIESFGAYAFNKSHSASYSVITYETQYYKEFATIIAYGVFLKHVKEKSKMQLIKEIKRRGIELELQTLDKNISLDFSINITRNFISLPLTYIKGIGDKEIYPFIELFKEYQIDSLEEMLLLSGAKSRKKVIDRLGQLGVLEKTKSKEFEHFCFVSAKEFFYLSGENEDEEHKGIINSVFDKAIKKPIVKNKYNKILSNYKKDFSEDNINENYLPNIWTNINLLSLLQTLKLLSLKFERAKEKSEGTNEEEKEILSFFQDIQAAEENLNKEVSKLVGTKKLFDYEMDILLHNIENKTFDFYKIGIFEETYKEYTSYFGSHIKELSKVFREEVITQYNELNISELLIKKCPDCQNIRTLSRVESSEINDRLLKEGNFDKNIGFDYTNYEDTVFLKRKEENEEPLIYNRFYKRADKTPGEANKTNVIYLTEFLPKVAKDGFESKHDLYGSKTQQFFVDLYVRLDKELQDKVKLGWMSYHQMTEPQFNEKFVDNYTDKEEYEEYLDNRFKKVLLNIADSKVENILLATQLKSKLMANIKKYKFKGFDPQYGDTAIVYLKNSHGEKVKKIFGFVPNMFPYKDLNPDKYESDLELIKKILSY